MHSFQQFEFMYVTPNQLFRELHFVERDRFRKIENTKQ